MLNTLELPSQTNSAIKLNSTFNFEEKTEEYIKAFSDRCLEGVATMLEDSFTLTDPAPHAEGKEKVAVPFINQSIHGTLPDHHLGIGSYSRNLFILFFTRVHGQEHLLHDV